MIKLIKHKDLTDDDGCMSCPYVEGACRGCSGGYFREVPDEPKVRLVRYIEADAKDGCNRCPYGKAMNGGRSRCSSAPIDCMGGFLRAVEEVEEVEEINPDDFELVPEIDCCIGCYFAGDKCSSKPQSMKGKCSRGKGSIWVKKGDKVEPIPTEDAGEELGRIEPPDRYNWRGTESLPFCIVNDLNTVQNNVVKYVYRYPKKGGLDALKKCVTYLEKGIKYNQRAHQVSARAVEKFITDNNFTWREGTVIMTVCLGAYSVALARVKDLIKEVYGEEVESR